MRVPVAAKTVLAMISTGRVSANANVLMILLPMGRWITDFPTKIPDTMLKGYLYIYNLS